MNAVIKSYMDVDFYIGLVLLVMAMMLFKVVIHISFVLLTGRTPPTHGKCEHWEKKE